MKKIILIVLGLIIVTGCSTKEVEKNKQVVETNGLLSYTIDGKLASVKPTKEDGYIVVLLILFFSSFPLSTLTQAILIVCFLFITGLTKAFCSFKVLSLATSFILFPALNTSFTFLTIGLELENILLIL